MNFEKLKNELELDEKLNVVAFESGVGDLLLYDNIMIVNYGGNGYRLIFDENHILIQLLTSAYMCDNGIGFDEPLDYDGNDIECPYIVYHLISGGFRVIGAKLDYCTDNFDEAEHYLLTK